MGPSQFASQIILLAKVRERSGPQDFPPRVLSATLNNLSSKATAAAARKVSHSALRTTVLSTRGEIAGRLSRT